MQEKEYLVMIAPRNSQSRESPIHLTIYAFSKDRAIAMAKAQVRANSQRVRDYSFQVMSRNGATKTTRRNSTATRTEVRSPTSTETSTEAYTADNVTVTGGAGAGATTKVTIIKKNPRKTHKHFVDAFPGMTEAAVRAYNDVAKGMTETAFYKKHKVGDYGQYKETSEKYPGRLFRLPDAKRNATANDFRQHQKVRLEELARMFQGEADGSKRRVLESDYTPKNKYRLGYLKLLKIKTPSGKTVTVNVDGDEKNMQAYVAADLRNNLLIVGKDARFEDVKLPPPGNLKYLGKLTQIDYVTAKRHIGGGKTIHFFHKLGEVTGEHPHIFVDSDGCPIIQSGGYDLWSVGIVN